MNTIDETCTGHGAAHPQALLKYTRPEGLQLPPNSQKSSTQLLESQPFLRVSSLSPLSQPIVSSSSFVLPEIYPTFEVLQGVGSTSPQVMSHDKQVDGYSKKTMGIEKKLPMTWMNYSFLN